MKHPIQPLETDPHGTIRFIPNKIVRLLLDTNKLDLNDIISMVAHGNYSMDDYAQLMMLIGYSYSSFSELTCSEVCWNEVETTYDAFMDHIEETK